MSSENVNQMATEQLEKQIDLKATLKERDEQLDALLQIISLLSKAVTTNNGYAVIDSSGDKDEDTFNMTSICTELDELSNTWKLEETAIPILMSEVTKIQSNMFRQMIL